MRTEAPATRAQALAAAMERSIAAEALGAGDALGTLESWRRRSGFGRGTVSEATRLLVDRGVVEVRPGRGGGLFVTRAGPVVRLRRTLLPVQGEATTLADALAVREALEPLVVADAARCRGAAQLERLRGRLEQVGAAVDDHDAFVRAVWALHREIAQITPNEMLRAMYLTALHVVEEHAGRARSDDEDQPSSAHYRRQRLDVHRLLVDAVDQGDPAAVRSALARHASGAEGS